MQVVGLQRGVKALFARYDRTASGRVAYGPMIRQLLEEDPDGERTTEMRNALTTLRRSLARHGIHGVLQLQDAMAACDSSGKGQMMRREVVEALGVAGVKLRDGPAAAILVELDRGGARKVSTAAVLEAVRGIMVARRRVLVNRAWDALTARGSGAKGSVTMADVITLLKDNGATWLEDDASVRCGGRGSGGLRGAAWLPTHPAPTPTTSHPPPKLQTPHLAWAFPDEAVTFAQFLAFHRSVSCVIADDKEWVAFITDSWGVSTDVPIASLTLPGTVEYRLQCTLAASRLLPGAAAGGAGRSPPGSALRTSRPSTVSSSLRSHALSGRAVSTATAAPRFEL